MARYPRFSEYSPPSDIIEIRKFAGLNISTTSTQIEENETPDALNIMLDSFAEPNKRYGYTKAFPTSLGSKIYGLFNYKKNDGSATILIHCDKKLFTWNGTLGTQPVQIYASMAAFTSNYFIINNKCYILDGTNYLQYDGTSVVDVSAIAYVPTILVSSPPTGGGTANENFNLLTPAFKQSFSGDGTATAYQLAVIGLDATTVTAMVGGSAKVEGTDFTVNRTTGTVTFTVAPPTGVPNNVVITAYKTVEGNANIIKQCRNVVIYGGTNDTRVFWFGNPAYPNFMYNSGLYNPTYAPDQGFRKVGSDSTAIVTAVQQYDTCVIFKAPAPDGNDTVIWNMSFNLDSSGEVSFPLKPINSQVGCLSASSLQLINNDPTWLSDRGVYQLNQSNVRDERNTQHISFKIDRAADQSMVGLLEEANLSTAVAVDYDKKYILTVGSTSYVFDYRQGAWFKWSNVPASCYLAFNNFLHFGSSIGGMVYRFRQDGELNAYSDDGTAINAYWKTKVMSFNQDESLKSVPKIWFSLKPGDATSADLYYFTDNYTSPLIGTSGVSQFNYVTWDYGNFSYLLSSFPQNHVFKVKANKVVYFQMMLQNDKAGESMGILSCGIQVLRVRQAK
jgi:hypothetical protein